MLPAQDLVALARCDDDRSEPPSQESIFNVLTRRHQLGMPYTRIGSSALLAVNPNQALNNIYSDVSGQHYADHFMDNGNLKNSNSTIAPDSGTLEPHIFELASTMYYHMRRTEMDQGVVLSGLSGSGKTTSQRLLVQQIIRLGAKSGLQSKVGTQIRAAQDILEAFGNCHSEHGANASCHSLFLELQFKARGRLFGAKLLPFMLNQERVTNTPSHLSNYQVFYSMFKEISGEDRKRLRLGNSAVEYPYLPYHPHMEYMNLDRDLNQAFSALGFKSRNVSQIWQMLATILHLGRIEFVDSAQDPTLMATVPKQKQVFELVASLLGVDEDVLQQALSYKRKMISGDLCTVILDSASAKNQCNSLARSLYSLLFTFLVEAMNKQLCRRQEDQVSFIGILDMPGFDSHSPTGFENFCTNFCNETLQGFLQQKVLVEDPQAMAADGLQVTEVRQSEHSLATIDLLCGLDTLTDAAPRGLIKFLHDATLKASKQGDSESNSILPALNRTFQSNSSFIAGSTYASSFGISHFAGDVHYNLDRFFVKNQDILAADFVSLLQSSTNSFIMQLLESNPALVMESHPRSKETIVKAQLSTAPLRQPSVRKPKQNQAMARRKGKTPNTVSTVLKQLHSTVRDICTSLDGVQIYQIIHIRPNNRLKEGLIECDPVLIRSQIESFEVSTLIHSKVQSEHCVSFDHASFLQRYKVLFERRGLNLDRSASEADQCKASTDLLEWSVPTDGAVGREYVWISFNAWKKLEDGCMAIEAEEGGAVVFEADPEEQRDFSSFISPPAQVHQRPNDDAAVHAQLLSNNRPRAGSDVSDDSQHYDHEQRSLYSDHKNLDTPSAETDSRQFMFQGYEKNDSDIKRKPTLAIKRTKADESVQPPRPKTKTRRFWVGFVWLNTFWIPSFCLSICGRMKRPDIQMAWREKVTLCLIVFWLSAVVIFFIIGLPKVICPLSDQMYSPAQVSYHTGDADLWVSIRGNVYDISKFAKNDHSASFSGVFPSNQPIMLQYGGLDLTNQFPVDLRWACPNLVTTPMNIIPKDIANTIVTGMINHGPSVSSVLTLPWFQDQEYYQNTIIPKLTPMKKGMVAIDINKFENQSGPNNWARMGNKVYDLTDYLASVTPPQGFVADPTFKPFIDKSVTELFLNNYGTDITKQFKALPAQVQADTLPCLDRAFYVGVLDERDSAKCQFGNWILVGASVLMGGVILIKFLAALQLTSKREPIHYDKFVICQVPCYTEGEESLKKTLESLAGLDYDDKHKLIFVIADGMIVGSGNDLPTPKIVLDVLGWKPTDGIEIEPVTYKALGIGGQQLNSCKVYSGLYEFEGHMVPYIVVAKVGMPNETSKPGNRGKRDSQLILMNFLNGIHTGKKMCPLELEIYHHLKHIIGVHPNLYEYILQVDADTEVLPDSLNRLVACMVADSKVIGLCGETKVANEDRSFTTMIQVYEYYISHHLAKSFESLFGSVTCLPGCFSMYRIMTVGGKPLIVSNKIVQDYSHNEVDTLHKKNLLSLGEDRYLTTLMMKYFPGHKLKFTPDAVCMTVAPDKWRVLLSQRRRWINSTIHNLGELMVLPELCGFCCFSMRFIVFIDLLGTLILPASFVYLVYLIVIVATGQQQLPIVAVAILAAVYGLQALIFILKGAFQHIGWMIIYIIAMPFFSVFIPLYSFWHFDDFSWGNTRKVVGADGNKTVLASEAQSRFDPNSIPLKSIEAFEAERMMHETGIYYQPEGSVIGSSYQDDLGSMSHSRFDHSGLLAGGVQSSQYTKLDSYGRAASPFYDGGSVVSGYGGEDPMHDYYRDSNAIELTTGRHSRIPSGVPLDYRARSATPMGPFADPQPQAQFLHPMGGGQLRGSMMMDHNGVLRQQASPAMQARQLQPGSGSLDSIEMNQLMVPNMGMSGVSSPAMGSSLLPMRAASPLLDAQQQQMLMSSPALGMSTIPLSPHWSGLGLQGSPVITPAVGSVGALSPAMGPTGIGADGMPTDNELTMKIRDILTGVDLMSVTKKKIRQQLEAFYGVDLTPRRDFLSRAVDMELQGRTTVGTESRPPL